MRLLRYLDQWYVGLGTRRVVLVCAVLAVLLHFPSLMWPLSPDESGYTLVARHWDPGPGSLYGHYWVDRPPLLLLVYKVADAIGGPYLLRLVAALGCFWLVVAAARTAFLVNGARAARWTAIVAAALTGTPLIDTVSAKGEILGIPLVLTSIWLSVEALERLPLARRQALLLAFGAGTTSTLALGMKQNMVTGLVFGGVLLVLARVVHDLSRRDFWRLAAAAFLGAMLPVGTTLAWCLWVGVGMDDFAYAVYGFRGDALEVIARQLLGDSRIRAGIITLYFVLTGMALFMVWLAVRLRSTWRQHPATTGATVAVIVVDGVSLGLSGSFWQPYLHLLTPGVLLAVILLAGTTGATLAWTRTFVAATVLSVIIALPIWVVQNSLVVTAPTAYATGEAISEVAHRGDTIMVHGGRADIVMGADIDAPYPYLWSLPARALDPDRDLMVSLLEGEDRVTWFIEWVPLDEWTLAGLAATRLALSDGYYVHATGCRDEVQIYVRNDVLRKPLELACNESWRVWDRLLED